MRVAPVEEAVRTLNIKTLLAGTEVEAVGLKVVAVEVELQVWTAAKTLPALEVGFIWL